MCAHHVHIAYVCMCMGYVYVFRLEVEVRGSLLLSTLMSETGSITEPGAFWLARLTGQWVPEIHLSHSVLWLQTYATTSCLYIRCWDLNLGHLACARSSPIEPISMPGKYLLLVFYFIKINYHFGFGE